MFKALDTSGTDSSHPTVSLKEFVEGLPLFFGQCKSFNILKVTKKLEWALTLLQDATGAVLQSQGKRRSRLSIASSFAAIPQTDGSAIPEVEKELNNFTTHFDGELSRLDE